ncbi:Toxin-antitoxin system, toxin component, PIN family [uncultured Desulfatiglans sp.]|nr:Toxin-antitoxin system, toxin component, PIN family [uncultured Desulfatiglans sp.]
MKRLFVDTAGWMAMADRQDPLHVSSLQARDRWLEEGGILVMSNYVVDETLTLIRMRLGISAAERWYDLATQSPRCKTEWITHERQEKAVKWFFKWRDQSFSLTDCTSFVVMKELGIEKALTADHHFRAAGFAMLPSS